MTNCNLTPSTVNLIIENTNVPLKLLPVEFGHAKVFVPKDSSYFIQVPGASGRFISARVVGHGITLDNTPPVGFPCGTGWCYWQVNLDTVNGFCTQSNPASIPFNAGPPKDELYGLVYMGAQVFEHYPAEHCLFRIVVRVKRYFFGEVCEIKCVEQTVNVPAARILSLTDNVGFQMNLSGNQKTECTPGGTNNQTAAAAIRQLILSNCACADPGLQVTVVPNGLLPNCVTVKLVNSPIKVSVINTSEGQYAFNWNKC